MKPLAIALLFALFAAPTKAQIMTFGTDPDAPVTRWGFPTHTEWVAQTFETPLHPLRSISVWFHGGGLGSSPFEPAVTRFTIYEGTSYYDFPSGPVIFTTFLDQFSSGKQTIFLGDLLLDPSRSYFFAIRPGGYEAGVIELTGDTYAGGELVSLHAEPDIGHSDELAGMDIRFQAVVPEPATVVLLLTGLVMMGALSGSRRGGAKIQLLKGRRGGGPFFSL